MGTRNVNHSGLLPTISAFKPLLTVLVIVLTTSITSAQGDPIPPPPDEGDPIPPPQPVPAVIVFENVPPGVRVSIEAKFIKRVGNDLYYRTAPLPTDRKTRLAFSFVNDQARARTNSIIEVRGGRQIRRPYKPRTSEVRSYSTE